MSETDRLTSEEEERQEVLLKARGYLVTLLSEPESESQLEVVNKSLDELILANPWLIQSAYKLVERDKYKEYTPLSVLGESVRREMGKAD